MPGTAKRPASPRGDSRALVEIRDRLRRLEALVADLVRERPPRTEAEMDEAAKRALADPVRIPLDGVLDALGR